MIMVVDLWKMAGGLFLFAMYQMEDDLFVLTPQAEVELNITPWMKINTGLGYRFVSDVDTPYLNQNNFTSMVGNLSFYFGWFNSGYSF